MCCRSCPVRRRESAEKPREARKERSSSATFLAGSSGTQFVRKGLAIGPYCAVGKTFFFPDWDCALEGIDGKAAGVEGGCAMRRSDRDEHAGLADLQSSQAMNNGDFANLVVRQCLLCQRVHLGDRHWLITFIIEK